MTTETTLAQQFKAIPKRFFAEVYSEFNTDTQREEITVLFTKDGVQYPVVFTEDYFKDD